MTAPRTTAGRAERCPTCMHNEDHQPMCPRCAVNGPCGTVFRAPRDEAVALALAALRAEVEGLPRYLGTVPHPYGSSVALAQVFAAIDRAAKP